VQSLVPDGGADAIDIEDSGTFFAGPSASETLNGDYIQGSVSDAALGAKVHEILDGYLRGLQSSVNPPQGAQAQVGGFTAEGLETVIVAIGNTAPHVLISAAGMPGCPTGMLTDTDANLINNAIRGEGGVPATLLTAATGGTLPPLPPLTNMTNIVHDSIVTEVPAPPPLIRRGPDEHEVRERIREVCDPAGPHKKRCRNCGGTTIMTETDDDHGSSYITDLVNVVLHYAGDGVVTAEPAKPPPPGDKVAAQAQVVTGKLLDKPRLAVAVLAELRNAKIAGPWELEGGGDYVRCGIVHTRITPARIHHTNDSEWPWKARVGDNITGCTSIQDAQQWADDHLRELGWRLL